MRRIAVPVERGKLDSCFERCKRFKIIEVKDCAIVKESTVVAPLFEMQELSDWLVGNSVTDVIVNRIKQELVKICNLNKVNVFVGVQNKALNELVQDYIDGVLLTNGDMVGE